MIPIVRANGAEIPALGFGTWPMKGDAALRAVTAALASGYRHIDTAAMYGNEAEVGEALRSHGTPREEVFVTTKVWPSEASEGKLQRSAEGSLKRLRMDRVDLLLIHWPNRDVTIAEQVRALCDAKRRGLARHVGISNFSPADIEEALAVADEPIVTNQIEHHPYIDQSATFAACRKYGISVTSYSPVGKGRVLDDPIIVEIARAKRKTPAQIVLRWHLEQPMNVAIPKSADPRRIAENIDVFDFSLTPEEIRLVSKLAHADANV